MLHVRECVFLPEINQNLSLCLTVFRRVSSAYQIGPFTIGIRSSGSTRFLSEGSILSLRSAVEALKYFLYMFRVIVEIIYDRDAAAQHRLT